MVVTTGEPVPTDTWSLREVAATAEAAHHFRWWVEAELSAVVSHTAAMGAGVALSEFIAVVASRGWQMEVAVTCTESHVRVEVSSTCPTPVPLDHASRNVLAAVADRWDVTVRPGRVEYWANISML